MYDGCKSFVRCMYFKYFHHSDVGLFTLLLVSFDEQKFLFLV